MASLKLSFFQVILMFVGNGEWIRINVETGIGDSRIDGMFETADSEALASLRASARRYTQMKMDEL
ncbi:MAG: hypothetical protein U7123_14235 [Potamolinea sp.]